MAASSSISSNALNFMSAVKSGVDPRTGLYGVSISLPDIQANDLRGPGLALNLAYSVLNKQDNGYGTGWNLQQTQLDMPNNVITLSTGEALKVTSERQEGLRYRLLMREQKIDSFHLYREKQPNGADQYRVIHKSGQVEILRQPHSSSRFAVPALILGPTGHRLRLSYEPFNTSGSLLKEVIDDTNTVVLRIVRNPSPKTIELKLHPAGGPGATPLATYTMGLSSTGHVESISLPGDAAGSWHFDYGTKIRDYLCIRAVDTPLGGHETLTYADAGHLFPDDAHPALPRVTEHVIDPGFEQPAITLRYTYTNKDGQPFNFLGRGLLTSWVDNGEDNLYKSSSDYEYACTESLYAGTKVVRSVTRTFNRLHLLTTETTTQEANVQTVETVYGMEPNWPFEDQPPHCQLPMTVTTTWKNNDSGRVRSEVVSNTYDANGNLQTTTFANGVMETNEWYPSTASDGCPADPEGFVRQLKEKRTTPAQVAGDAPSLATRYRYASLPAVAALPDSGMLPWLTVESETVVQHPGASELELQRLEYTHINNSARPFEHGRPNRQSTILPGLDPEGNPTELKTVVNYTYEKITNARPGLHVQRTTETLTGFDTTGKSTVREHSLLTGSEVTSKVDGVEIQYAYDSLGRLMTETVSPASLEYEASRHYQYRMLAPPSTVKGAKAQLQAVMLETDAMGVTTRTWLDGCGRVVLKQQDNVPYTAPAAFRNTYAALYDASSNLVQTLDTDYGVGGVAMALKTVFTYDDWGLLYCTTGPDQVRSFSQTDPIGTPDGPVQRSWQQGPAADPLASGITETRLNLFDKPLEIRQFPAGQVPGTPGAQPYAVQTFAYDGLGRCVSQTSQHDPSVFNTTQFIYDPWSRLATTILPDDTQVARSYAAHSTAELPTQVSVTANSVTRVLGMQTFDGLERRATSAAGGRTQHYAYEPGLTQVSTRTTAAGNAIHYTYNLQLTDQPVSAAGLSETARFAYHPTTARLLEASNELGTRTYEFNLSNQLTLEHWLPAGGPGWKTRHGTSLQGRPLKRTDLEQDTAGLATEYVYDERTGRLQRLDQGHLQATFGYDALGRLSLITTKDLDNNSQLHTALEYDDYGRETLRTLTLSGSPARTLSQTWYESGLLKSRHFRDERGSLLEETFGYDSRGRLVSHMCEGTQLPVDELGRRCKQQTFSFDGVDNIYQSRQEFDDGFVEIARFDYAAQDPCQLTQIRYLPPGRPEVNFSYDPDGNQLNDEHGRTLVYDHQGRLIEAQGSPGLPGTAYQYDGHDHLVSTAHGGAAPVVRFYQGEQLCATVQDNHRTYLMYHGGQPLGQQSTASADTLLLQTNANNSVLAQSQSGVLRSASYTAYGVQHSDEPLTSLLAFNGEVLEQDSGWYLLGRGYRAYNPGLMRFQSPDSLSPFGSGGLNPYTYCLGNPIALRDPTGHASTGWGRLPRHDDYWNSIAKPKAGFEAWMNIAIGAVFTAVGVATFITSMGTAAPVSLALIGLGTLTQGASVAASTHAVITGNEESAKTASILGYVALAAAVPTMVGGMLKMGGKAVTAAAGASDDFFGQFAIPRPKLIGAKGAASVADDLPGSVLSSRSNMGTQTPSSVLPGPAKPAVAQVAADVTDARSRLLQEIRTGVVLKHVPSPMQRVADSATNDQLEIAIRALGQGSVKGVRTATSNANAMSGQSTIMGNRLHIDSIAKIRN